MRATEGPMLEAFFSRYAATYPYAKTDGAWCYEDGCVYRGLIELHRATGDAVWDEHLRRLVGAQIGADGTLRGYDLDSYNIDNILAGRALFHLGGNDEERFARATHQLAAQLASHPRTRGGNYWHKRIYPHQVWLDGLYMGLPFQLEYGLLNDRPELVDDAVAQLERALAIMHDTRTGLYRHGYDESRSMYWADSQTGLSKAFWARAVGWLSMALADMVELLPAAHPRRAAILAATVALADVLMGYRTANGLWLQVLDQPDLAGNYEETSACAMFAYFLLRTARHSRSPHLAEAGVAALEAIVRLNLRPAPDGATRLENICEVAGLGRFRDRERDGTAEYYVSEQTVADDPKGVGPLMMAHAERIMLEAGAAPALRGALTGPV